jgi:hypothetical protein
MCPDGFVTSFVPYGLSLHNDGFIITVINMLMPIQYDSFTHLRVLLVIVFHVFPLAEPAFVASATPVFNAAAKADGVTGVLFSMLAAGVFAQLNRNN